MKPGFTTAALGRIERKKATASSALRGTLVRYWTRIRDSRERQGWCTPNEVVTHFREYALSVFDAKAEEHLLVTNQSPQDFIQFLRDDLVSQIWSEFEGEGGVWQRIVEDSLTLSNFDFSRIHGRRLGRTDYLLPRGSDVIEAAMRDRIDS